jgi:hypothetical protein
MPDSFQAAIVVAIALVPGALYFWAFERQAGRWGVALSDRVLRFVGLSALLHAAIAPVSYWFWANQWPKIREGMHVSLWLWALAIAYVAVPLASGTATGYATRLGLPWSRWFAGPHPAPRAWDYLFESELVGWVRMRMKSGVWIGGVFGVVDGRRSYTAGYPEQQDLFLTAMIDVDPETGEFPVDEDGDIVHRPGGVLVRWEEIEYLQFVEPEGTQHGKFGRTAPSASPQGLRRGLRLFWPGHLGVQAPAEPWAGSRGTPQGSRGDQRQQEVARRTPGG